MNIGKKRKLFLFVVLIIFASIFVLYRICPQIKALSLFKKEGRYQVTQVIDGDTIILSTGEHVRLIGLDTPELHHHSKPVMYFAQESREFTRRLVEGQEVRLEYDWQKKDKYNRTLAYVYLLDGRLLNAEIINQGYGFAYVRFPFKYIDEFREYQREAMEEGRGLWGETLGNPKISNLIRLYENLNPDGKLRLEEYLEFLSNEYAKGEESDD